MTEADTPPDRFGPSGIPEGGSAKHSKSPNRLAPAEARAVSIPEEILDNPEPFVEEVLEEWHASRPQYPTDPEEWARRASLVRQDPAYSILKQHHEDPSTPEEEKFRLSLQMAARRRGIMTAPKPEELIAAETQADVKRQRAAEC